MSTCKDCHNCAFDLMCTYMGDWVGIRTPCPAFKDKSRFVELKHAEWVEDEDVYGDPIYRCSACNERFVLEEGTPIENRYFYCPNCGAMMGDTCPLPKEGDDE